MLTNPNSRTRLNPHAARGARLAALSLILSAAAFFAPANAWNARAAFDPSHGFYSVGEPVAYPDTKYYPNLEVVRVPLKGITREYRIAWVSDLHMITDRAAGGVTDTSLERVLKRYNTFSITKEGVRAEDLWPNIVENLNAGNYDAIVFGGDMLDYCSPSNMRALKKGFDELRYDKDKILYLRADHDYAIWYADGILTQQSAYDLHRKLDGDALDKKYLDMGEFVLIGINESTKNMTENQLSLVKSQCQKAEAAGKPIVIATHVPYASAVDPTLQALSLQVKNTKYYWQGDWQPNDTMRRYLDFLFGGQPRSEQVLAGHLHAPWDGMMTAKTREHIFSPALEGNIGVIHFIPE